MIQVNRFKVSSISCRATQTPKQAPKPALSACGQAGSGGRLSQLRITLVAAACIAIISCKAGAQQIAVKTNALYWATATPDLGAEFAITPRSTISLDGAWNPWNPKGNDIDAKRLKHYRLEGEYRIWPWESFNGHFFGLHGFYAAYDFSGRTVPFLFDNEHQYKGDSYGLGVSYGFHLMLSPAWGIEAFVGAGVARLSFNKNPCLQCTPLPEHISETYVGPTKIGISLIYIIH
ncbi:MAG: DUF3575 domain-containing protein [Tannerellaceae bacterium]|jgi:hypothetical protein|nr:DUF3575 domain-containing protein [Tannerellaceae bacterium]